MSNKAGIIHELRKAVKLYSELGFEYLPVKRADINKLIAEAAVSARQDMVRESGRAVERAVDHGDDQEDSLKGLREEIGDCLRCKLSTGRKNIVFGEGNPEAKLMFIGEGPGRDEDTQARPFVGEAGKLLTNMIVKLGLKREDVYIANIVKCRPPNNRDPEEDEIETCMPFVEKQIEMIKPSVIVCLGRISGQALLRSKVPIGKLRGNFYEFKGIPVMPTFHPAYLLRNRNDKWLTWNDMQKVLEKINAL